MAVTLIARQISQGLSYVTTYFGGVPNFVLSTPSLERDLPAWKSPFRLSGSWFRVMCRSESGTVGGDYLSHLYRSKRNWISRAATDVSAWDGEMDRFIAKLKEIGYEGSITIEREIPGKQTIKDIIAAIDLLEELKKSA